MVTTHRSELVDEIEKALTDEAYDGGSGAMSEQEFARYVHRLAETAGAVLADEVRRARRMAMEDLRQGAADAYPGAWERVTAFVAACDLYRSTLADAGGATLSLADLLVVLNMRLHDLGEVADV